MNPAANAGISGGLSGAVVTIINSLFVDFSIAPMTADVATAYGVVLTALFGYLIHKNSNDEPAQPPAPAPAPVDKAAA